MRQYSLTLSEEEKEENINDETVQNRNVNTFIQTSCSLFDTRNNINVGEKKLSLQATSESWAKRAHVFRYLLKVKMLLLLFLLLLLLNDCWTWIVFKTTHYYYFQSILVIFLFTRSPYLSFSFFLFLCRSLADYYLLLTSSSSVLSCVSRCFPFRNDMVFHMKILQWNWEGGNAISVTVTKLIRN